MYNKKLNKKQLDYIKEKLKPLDDAFAQIAAGKYNVHFEIPEEENEFTFLYVGVKLLFDSIKEELKRINTLNKKLKSRSLEKGLILEEIEKIAHVGSWEWNLKQDKIMGSAEAFRIFELDPKQQHKVNFESLLKYTHPDDKRFVKYTFRKACSDLLPFKVFQRVKIETGQIKFLEIRGQVKTDKKNKPTFLYGTVQDVTKLKEAEDKLILARQELEAKVEKRTRDLKNTVLHLKKEVRLKEEAQKKKKELASIVESSSDAIISKTLDGIVKSWNQGAYKMYGYTEEEMIGNHISKIIPREKIKEFNQIMERILAGKKVSKTDTLRVKKNGKIVHVSLTISPIKDEEGRVIGASAIGRDVTQERIQNKKFKIAVEAAPNGMIMINEKGRIVMLNKQINQMFGYNQKELLGKSIEILIPQELRKSHIKNRENYQKNPNTRVMGLGRELHGKTKDGSTIIVEIGLNPIDAGDEKLILASVVDVTHRKEMESELKESERKYKTLLQTMNEGVLVVDSNDVITFANEFMYKMLGYELNEVLGKKANELLLDKEGQKQMKKITALRKKGKSTKYEIQILTKNKERIWALVSGTPIYDENGNIVGSVGLHTNITDRKIAEERLSFVANIPEENPNPIIRLSSSGKRVLYFNHAGARLYKLLLKSYKKTERKKWSQLISKIYEQGETEIKEIEIDDRIYKCVIVPVKNKDYVNTYINDITEVKAAEAEVKRLSLVISKSDNAVIIADAKGDIKWVNKGFEKVSGYTLEEIKGTHGEQLRKGKKTGLNVESALFKKMANTHDSVSYEARNFRKNGEEYWTITTLTPIFDDLGQLESVIAIDSDITHKKEAERQIIKAKRAAEESAKAKELFLANMSHEIRTPMNAIMGIIQLLRDTEMTVDQMDYLKSMEFSGENLLRIINDVLDLSKIESGKMSIEKVPFNINEIVGNTFHSMEYKADEKGIKLIRKIAHNVPEIIVGDPVRINQILMNLLSNAIKFTKKGSVTLEVKPSKIEKETVNLKFIVKDTGIGISEDVQGIIFDDFEQANKEATRKYGGTGLGLSIVKRLVELQNGSISFKSKKNKGSTFIVNLQYKISKGHSSQDESEKKTKAKNKMLEGKTALIVEDNALNQMVANKFLKTLSMIPTIANNGIEAIDFLSQNTYDIILMDIQMPKMDGYETTKNIREKLKSDIPILAMTAHAIGKEKQKCIAAGMNDYISKPLKREHLSTKIINLLNK